MSPRFETISRCFHASIATTVPELQRTVSFRDVGQFCYVMDPSLPNSDMSLSLAKTLYNFLDARGQLSLCGGFVCVPNRKRTAIYNFQLRRGKWCSAWISALFSTNVSRVSLINDIFISCNRNLKETWVKLINLLIKCWNILDKINFNKSNVKFIFIFRFK